MAAPEGTKWGSTVGSYGRIGIYTSLSSTATKTTIKVQVWFWSKYSVSDTSNTLYYTLASSSSSAEDSKGSVSISTTSDSGGWSTTNQKKLYEYTHAAITRSTSAQTRYLYAKLSGVDRVGGTMYASTTVQIPALASYAVSYNANGGSGAPSKQTKYYGKSLTLSKTKPTRTGYTFEGWATSESDSVAYAAGASYTANAAVTLYAIWQEITYTVTYDANGGTGAPANQTKKYTTDLTLSTTKPTRTNYNFKGWGTSESSTTVSYASGASYTTNANITLYAIWELAYIKPRITDLSVTRCTSDGTPSQSGTYALVQFDWATDKTVSSIAINWKLSTDSAYTGTVAISASGTTDTVKKIIIESDFSVSNSYDIQVVVFDSGGSTTKTATLQSQKYTIHAKAGGDGIAFGKSSELANTADFDFEILARKKMQFLNDKAIYGTDTDGTEYNALIPVTASGNTSLGHGLYKAGKGHTHIYGNDVRFYTNEGIYTNGNKVVMDNATGLHGTNTDGSEVELISQSDNDNTIIGYDNYEKKSGNVHIYGHDINHFVSNIATPGSYRPYRRKGDSIEYTLQTAGYVTNSGKEVWFFIPLTMPAIGGPIVTVASNLGFILRQGTKYTHGSSASAYCKPDSYTAANTLFRGISVKATFSNVTNVTNNDAIGIYWNGTVTFS